MSSSVHVDNRKKDVLILGKGPTDGLDNTTLTAEKEYLISFREHNKRFRLILHYNGANSYTFVNSVEIHKFKAKEIKATLLCLGSFFKYFSVDNMKKAAFHENVYDFSVDCDTTAVDDVLDIHKYLMKKNNM